MYVHLHVCMYAYMYVCVRACTICMCVCSTYVCMYVMYVMYICIHVYMMCMYMMWMCVNTYIQIGLDEKLSGQTRHVLDSCLDPIRFLFQNMMAQNHEGRLRLSS